jgi:hypothetical protein
MFPLDFFNLPSGKGGKIGGSLEGEGGKMRGNGSACGLGTEGIGLSVINSRLIWLLLSFNKEYPEIPAYNRSYNVKKG